ncbi:hypothetical protein [Bradyrhizobium murdochi]|nr:hypothetical protein [Bradyrhizobium murdochi]
MDVDAGFPGRCWHNAGRDDPVDFSQNFTNRFAELAAQQLK